MKSQLRAIKSIRKSWGFNPVRVVPDKTKFTRKFKFVKEARHFFGD